MDQKTIDAYNNLTKEIAERHRAAKPERLYNLAETFFKKNGATLDLGSGIGRDTNWLSQNGYPAIGIDPSEGMLTYARKQHPKLDFKLASLPNLQFEEKSFENIFCSAVLMHIPRSDLVNSVVNILKALKPQGRIVLSYRNGNGETDGRLFETYHPGQVAQLFESLGGKVLLVEQDGIWNNLVIEKGDSSKREGIQQIQDIITRDKKVATYKFALLRALCEISRYESHIVTWHREGDMVLVPMKRIAARWVYYYWPLVKANVRQTTARQMAFEPELEALPYKLADMAFLKNDVESDKPTPEISKLIKKISKTIQAGPVKYAGGGDNDIFDFVSKLDASVYPELKESEQGMVTVPLTLWRDLNLFSHWIEDSLSIQWAELTEKINKDGKFGQHLDLITRSVQEDERTTYIIRKIFNKQSVECVWSGKIVKEFAVDHMIPWSLWRNNDLWNLLPAHPSINNQKRDFLPTPSLVAKRFDVIKGYWEQYYKIHPELFARQIQRGLGISLDDAFGKVGCEALKQTLIRVNLVQGGASWIYK